jgi:hypothetical protein
MEDIGVAVATEVILEGFLEEVEEVMAGVVVIEMIAEVEEWEVIEEAFNINQMVVEVMEPDQI